MEYRHIYLDLKTFIEQLDLPVIIKYSMRKILFTPAFYFLFSSFIYLGLAVACNEPKDDDPRMVFLSQDIEKMTNTTSKRDTIINYVRLMLEFVEVVSEKDIEAETFKYLMDSKDDKYLILIRFPEMVYGTKKGAEEAILEIDGLIQEMSQEIGDTRDCYLGILGKRKILVSKTPSGIFARSESAKNALLEYYVPAPK